MSAFYRGFAMGLLAVEMIAAGGCGFGRKPYAADPLIRKNRAVWGDREKARILEDSASLEPIVPPPPKSPLIGGPID